MNHFFTLLYFNFFIKKRKNADFKRKNCKVINELTGAISIPIVRAIKFNAFLHIAFIEENNSKKAVCVCAKIQTPPVKVSELKKKKRNTNLPNKCRNARVNFFVLFFAFEELANLLWQKKYVDEITDN